MFDRRGWSRGLGMEKQQKEADDGDERLLRQLERVAEAEKLLQRDAVISGMSKFVAAAMRGDVEEVRRLLEANTTAQQQREQQQQQQQQGDRDEGIFGINDADEESQTALHWASFYNETAVVDLILSAPECDPNTRNKRGATALHQAVIGGAHRSLLRLLQEPSVEINATNCWGETPLILSAQTGDVEAARMLLEANARIDILDKWQQSALDVASDHDEFGVLNLLTAHATGSQVHLKVEKKDASHVHPLKEIEEEKETTPKVKQQIRVLSKLMEAPLSDDQFGLWLKEPLIDVISADFYGWRPLHKCAAWNKFQSLQNLLSHPLITELIDHPDLQTHGSASQKSLLSGPNGDSPLHCALEMGANEAALGLCTLVDPKITTCLAHFCNNDGVSCLMMAAACQNTEICRILLQNGADPLEKSKRGDTPLQIADRSSNADLSSLLRSFVDPSLLETCTFSSSSSSSSSQSSSDTPSPKPVKKLDRSKFAALSRALSRDPDSTQE